MELGPGVTFGALCLSMTMGGGSLVSDTPQSAMARSLTQKAPPLRFLLSNGANFVGETPGHCGVDRCQLCHRGYYLTPTITYLIGVSRS